MNKISKNLMEEQIFRRTFKVIYKFINKHILRWIDFFFSVIYRKIYSLFVKTQKNKIVFVVYQGTYTCNAKYITEELLKRKDKKLDIVWLVNKRVFLDEEHDGIPKEVRVVQKGTANAVYELMTARIWVDNALNCLWKLVPKKKDQIYLNTWHGSLGIKRLDTYNPMYWKYIARKSRKAIDYFLTNSEFENQVFEESYWQGTGKKMIGHARNDIFFAPDIMKKLKKKVCEFYELDPDTKILLYAPTFRGDKEVDAYDIDYEKLYQALNERYPGKWKLLLRYHFHNRRHKMECAKEEDYIVNATKYPDIQELMAAADIGITDYSSWIYDYMLTRRPCFIYASDMEKYNEERGFYYKLETTPFMLAKNTKQLCDNIKSFEQDVYEERLEAFLKDKGCMEDGKASERIVDFMMPYFEE